MPHDPELRSKWKHQINKHQVFDDIPISFPVCALHFDATQIVRRGKRTTLEKGALPFIFPKYTFLRRLVLVFC